MFPHIAQPYRSAHDRLNLTVCALPLLLLSASQLIAASARASDPNVPATQTFALTDIHDLIERGLHAEPAEYIGRKAVRLTRPGEDGAGTGRMKIEGLTDGRWPATRKE